MAQYALSPYSAATLHSTISELYVDPNTHTAKVQWSSGYAVRATGSTVTIPTALKVDSTYLIFSEVSYLYTPTIGYVMGQSGVNLSDVSYTGRVNPPACSTTPRSARPIEVPGLHNEKAALCGAALSVRCGFRQDSPGFTPPGKSRQFSGAQIVGRRLARAAVGHDLVGDLLALAQRAEAGAFDSADVHEHIVAAVIRLDEAIALGCVKPLHGPHAHGIVPSQI